MVLCAATQGGCDHCNCHGGPFLVGSSGVSIRDTDVIQARVYSSQLGAWGVSASLRMFHVVPSDIDGLDDHISVKMHSGAIIDDKIYFVLLAGVDTHAILRYDLVGHSCLSTIDLRPHSGKTPVALMLVEDGSLGIATTRDSTLYSAQDGERSGSRWMGTTQGDGATKGTITH